MKSQLRRSTYFFVGGGLLLLLGIKVLPWLGHLLEGEVAHEIRQLADQVSDPNG